MTEANIELNDDVLGFDVASPNLFSTQGGLPPKPHTLVSSFQWGIGRLELNPQPLPPG